MSILIDSFSPHSSLKNYRLEEINPKIVKLSVSYGSKRPLTVQNIVRDDYDEREKIADIVAQWRDLAEIREEQVEDTKEKAIFSDSYFMNNVAFDELTGYCSGEQEVWTCRDIELGLLQAVAITYDEQLDNIESKKEESYLKIHVLVTNPRNIRSSSNLFEKSRVEGAASKILAHLCERAAKNNQGIYLHVLKNAVPFYEKYGFSKMDAKTYDLDPGREWLQLSLEKVLLKSKLNEHTQ